MPTNKYDIDVGVKGAKKVEDLGKKVDKTGASMGRMRERTNGLKSAVSSLRGQLVIAAAAAGATIAVFKKFVDLAAKQEAAEKRLSIALGHTSTELVKYAAALQQKTIYGDESIIEAEALIAAFVDETDQIKQATKATLDLAAAKQMDLTAAADLVSKTLGSSTNALARYGIEVTGAVGSVERLDSLMVSVNQKFGGQAQGAVETMTGSLSQMSNALGDAGEAVGELISPMVVGFSHIVKSVAEGVQSTIHWKDALKELQKQAEIIPGAVVEIDKFKNSLKGLSEIDLTKLLLDINTHIPGGIAIVTDSLQLWIDKYNLVMQALSQTSGEPLPLESLRQFNNGLDLTNMKIDQTNLNIQKVKDSAGQWVAVQKVISMTAGAAFSGMAGDISATISAFKGSEKAAKRFAQLQATVDAYGAANAAFKSTAEIVPFGPALAPFAAAAALAAGLANVRRIEAAAEGMDQIVTRPTMILAGEAGTEHVQITNLDKPGGGVNSPSGGINIYGDVYGYDDFRAKVGRAVNDNSLGFA